MSTCSNSTQLAVLARGSRRPVPASPASTWFISFIASTMQTVWPRPPRRPPRRTACAPGCADAVERPDERREHGTRLPPPSAIAAERRRRAARAGPAPVRPAGERPRRRPRRHRPTPPRSISIFVVAGLRPTKPLHGACPRAAGRVARLGPDRLDQLRGRLVDRSFASPRSAGVPADGRERRTAGSARSGCSSSSSAGRPSSSRRLVDERRLDVGRGGRGVGVGARPRARARPRP